MALARFTPNPGEGLEERFRLLVESVKDYGIFILDPGGHVTTWNAGAERLTGYAPAEIIGKHFSVFYPHDDASSGKCAGELEIASLEGRFEEEGWRLRKDGARFWASVIITALRSPDGRLVGFAKVTRDLTERKRAEEEARRFRLLVDSVEDYAIFMLDPGGHITTWNLGAERLKGYAPAEIIGKHFSVLYPLEEARSGKCAYELEVASREGRFEEEGPRVRKDGSLFWASVTITALRGDDGSLVGFAKVTRDLSERKALEERQRALAVERAALAERAQIQDFQERFLAILGHDLRNPLAAITMGASLLRQQAGNSATVARIVERMHTSSARMTRMIEQILDLTRSRLSGGLEVNPTPVDLGATLSGIAEETRTAHPGRIIELSGPTVTGSWDRDRLEQVFSNLVGNAVSHGSPTGKVTVRVRTDGASVHVEVHNLGEPIPEALQEELFNPFRRGERDGRSKQTAGLGLGLFISREIVLAHGGALSVRSTAEEGTTFCVSLPTAPKVTSFPAPPRPRSS